MTGITQLGNLTQTSTMMQNVKVQSENNKFADLVNSARGSVSSDKIVTRDTRLNGDVASDFSGTFQSEGDKTARASGFAANSAKAQTKTIDKTSKLYEKSMELESFFVKMMVDSMRKTVTKANGENGFAQKMYEDMLYDEYTTALTKNAGFGIADSIYLELSR
ncbi:MAG: rod-binding protein [Treponema sp.]|nr:rod-binding protein [Candidatus Treponema merdequi]